MLEHPEIAKDWHSKSNYLCLLAVDNELELYNLLSRAVEKDIKFSIFREPDIDNQITAIALAPGAESKLLCSKLKLALR